MLSIGRFHDLEVASLLFEGALLVRGRDEVLLPAREMPEGTKVGDTFKVFVYTDKQEQLVATLATPAGQLGDFVALEVTDLNEHGAFFAWGLPKDLFCPWALQHRRMRLGERHVVRIVSDKRVNRLVATGLIAKELQYEVRRLDPGTAVEVLVFAHNSTGAQVIVDGRYLGMVYPDAQGNRPRVGDRLTGYVQRLRDDNRLDISLTRLGRKGQFDAQVEVLTSLMDHDGFLPLTDNSPPEQIERALGMSKKAFKRAVGSLYKARRIRLEDDGIRLVAGQAAGTSSTKP